MECKASFRCRLALSAVPGFYQLRKDRLQPARVGWIAPHLHAVGSSGSYWPYRAGSSARLTVSQKSFCHMRRRLSACPSEEERPPVRRLGTDSRLSTRRRVRGSPGPSSRRSGAVFVTSLNTTGSASIHGSLGRPLTRNRAASGRGRTRSRSRLRRQFRERLDAGRSRIFDEIDAFCNPIRVIAGKLSLGGDTASSRSAFRRQVQELVVQLGWRDGKRDLFGGDGTREPIRINSQSGAEGLPMRQRETCRICFPDRLHAASNCAPKGFSARVDRLGPSLEGKTA